MARVLTKEGARDMPGLGTVALVVSMAGGLLAAFSIIGWCTRTFVRLVRGLFRLIEDWTGEPVRPGFAGRPGFPERLARVELDLAEVRSQLSPNSGHTLRDAIDRVEAATASASQENS